MSEQTSQWAVLDELLGVEATPVLDDGGGALAFYGRCSTEDNQDPETSRAWQLGNARSSSNRSAVRSSRSTSTSANRAPCLGNGATWHGS